MDVTKENFIELLPEITETIRTCEFIAIDTELSGLMRERSSNRFDLPEERFAKTVESSRGYFIMQFGLSCFSRIKERHYDNRTYNFYIFPQANEGYGDIDRTFSLQAHAIQFLTQHNFDFNKLFKHGVSYLTYQEKQQLTSRLKQELKKDKQKAGDSQIKHRANEEEQQKQKEALIIAKGFLEVLELVIVNKKPLIGHNLALDLIQIINQFMEPLDNDYFSFKAICHSLFSLIYDTKYIAHSLLKADSLTNNQSRLNDLYCQCKVSDDLPRITVDHLDDILDDNQLPHQAGYDAFMSGYCFLVLCEAYLKETKNSNKIDKTGDFKSVSTAQNPQIIEEFANKIYLSYSYDFKYFNLHGDEEEPDRSHVFYIEYPKSWLMEDIFQLFQKQGGVTVGRLTRTSSLFALRDPRHIGYVLELAKSAKKNNRNFRIYTYETYLEIYKPKIKKEAETSSFP